MLAFPAVIECEAQLIAVIVVRCPADRDSGAVADGGQGFSSRFLAEGDSGVLGRRKIDGDLLRLTWLLLHRIRTRTRRHHDFIHHRRQVHRQIVDGDCAHHAARMLHQLPLHEP